MNKAVYPYGACMLDIEYYKTQIEPLKQAAGHGNQWDDDMYEICLAIVEGQEVNALEVAVLDSWLMQVDRLGADV